jgi:ABC-type uncharacterized transport system permease subunit
MLYLADLRVLWLVHQEHYTLYDVAVTLALLAKVLFKWAFLHNWFGFAHSVASSEVGRIRAVLRSASLFIWRKQLTIQ